MKKSAFYIILTLVLSIGLLYSCTSNEHHNVPEYSYAAIHTAKSKNKSIIDIYNSNGSYIDSYEINIGGLTGGAFMKVPAFVDEKIYITSPIFTNKSREFISQINSNDFSINELISDKPPTTFAVYGDSVYLGSSLTDGFYIAKTSINENTISNTVTLNGVGNYLLADNNYIFAFSKIDNDSTKYIEVSILSNEDLSVIQQFNISNIVDIQSAVLSDDILYLSAVFENNDEWTNSIVSYCIETTSMKQFEIPFKETYNIFIEHENLLISEFEGNGIIRFDINSHDITTFELQNENLSSIYANDILYSSDGNNIFSYETNSFELLNTFELHAQEDMRFISFFIK